MQKKSHKQQPEEAFVLSSKCFFPVMETRRRIVNFHFYEESCFLNDNTFTLFVVSLCIVYTYIYRIYIGDRIVRSNLYRNGFPPWEWIPPMNLLLILIKSLSSLDDNTISMKRESFFGAFLCCT